MNIPIVTDHFTPGIQKLLAIFGELIAFAFSLIILVYGGIKITSLAMGQMTSALGVTVGVFYVVMPLCGILNMIYTVLNIVHICVLCGNAFMRYFKHDLYSSQHR